MNRSAIRRFAAILLPLMAFLPARAAERAPSPGSTDVAWRSFDASALEAARKDGKLIFLSILAPWGHWDRIIREVTFKDPRIVSLLNDKFIPVRVDTLERPDLFTRYGMGGWPTTTFVLPTGQPLYYADPNGRIARAGGAFYSAESLLPFLDQMSAYYTAARETAENAAEEVARTVLARKEVGKAPLTPDMVEATVTLVMDATGDEIPDPNVKRPSHPDPDAAQLAFAYFIRKGNRDVLDTSLRRLAEMSRGGIQDQIGGGFHRFATDTAWRVPAFEKLLSSNAELLELFTDAHRLTQHTRYREIAEGIAGWVLRDMRDPAGWFRPYEAADARLGEDGDYYTWTLDEFKAALSDANESLLIDSYQVGEWGEMVESAPRRNVLHLAEGAFLLSKRLKRPEEQIAAALESGRKELLAARSLRPTPPIGDSMIVDANAAMAGALIRAGAFWTRQDLIDAGVKAIDFAWEKARDPGTGLFCHVWTTGGGRSSSATFFSDQVQMVRALLEGYEATGETRHLERAGALADAARQAFADMLEGGWTDRLYDESAPGLLSWPTRPIRENAQFAESLLRLRWILKEKADSERGKASRKALESWADEFSRYKEASAAFGLAVIKTLYPPIEIEIGGKPGDEGWEAMHDAARALYHPWRIVRYTPANAGVRFCSDGRCSEPVISAKGIRVKLWEFVKTTAGPGGAPLPVEGSPK